MNPLIFIIGLVVLGAALILIEVWRDLRAQVRKCDNCGTSKGVTETVLSKRICRDCWRGS